MPQLLSLSGNLNESLNARKAMEKSIYLVSRLLNSTDKVVLPLDPHFGRVHLLLKIVGLTFKTIGLVNDVLESHTAYLKNSSV